MAVFCLLLGPPVMNSAVVAAFAPDLVDTAVGNFVDTAVGVFNPAILIGGTFGGPAGGIATAIVDGTDVPLPLRRCNSSTHHADA